MQISCLHFDSSVHFNGDIDGSEDISVNTVKSHTSFFLPSLFYNIAKYRSSAWILLEPSKANVEEKRRKKLQKATSNEATQENRKESRREYEGNQRRKKAKRKVKEKKINEKKKEKIWKNTFGEL